MREVIILLLIAAAGYLAYDDYYRQRPALENAQAEIQQLRQNPVPVARYAPVNPSPPAWFQKHLDDGSSIEQSRKHQHSDERGTQP
jgi:hypothetical protein